MPNGIWINFKATPEFKATLQAEAHRHEMSVSAYLRYLVIAEKGKRGNHENH